MWILGLKGLTHSHYFLFLIVLLKICSPILVAFCWHKYIFSQLVTYLTIKQVVSQLCSVYVVVQFVFLVQNVEGKTDRNGQRTSIKQQSRFFTSHTNIPLAGHAVFSPQHQCGEGKHTARAREVMPLLKPTENETLNFTKRRSQKRIQFIVLNQQKM